MTGSTQQKKKNSNFKTKQKGMLNFFIFIFMLIVAVDFFNQKAKGKPESICHKKKYYFFMNTIEDIHVLENLN